MFFKGQTQGLRKVILIGSTERRLYRKRIFLRESHQELFIVAPQRMYMVSRLMSPSRPFVVAPSAISFAFFAFLRLSRNQQAPYRNPETTVKPAETALPWIYRGPCWLGYSCDETTLDTFAMEYAKGIPNALLESGDRLVATQVTASVEMG